ncbi:MAG: hypothetical protein ACRD3A_05175 [Terriglobales bacterium]
MKRFLLVSAFALLAATLAAAQRCNCPNIETQEIRLCSSEDCSGQIAMVGCDTIHRQNSCDNCQNSFETCCDRLFPSATSTGPCGFNNSRLQERELEMLAAAPDDLQVLVPNCAGGFIPLAKGT